LLCSTICGDNEEGCYRNASCALISTFLLLSLGHLLVDSPDGIIRPVVSVSALTLFISYNYNRNLQFLNYVIMIKTMARLPQAYMTLADCGYHA
jgi:hypothetical protein